MAGEADESDDDDVDDDELLWLLLLSKEAIGLEDTISCKGSAMSYLISIPLSELPLPLTKASGLSGTLATSTAYGFRTGLAHLRGRLGGSLALVLQLTLQLALQLALALQLEPLVRAMAGSIVTTEVSSP